MDRRMKINASVIFTELEGSAVLLHLDTKRYYTLNSTGVAIWQGLKLGKSENEISDELEKEYHAGRDQLSASVARIFDELEKAQLISRFVERREG